MTNSISKLKWRCSSYEKARAVFYTTRCVLLECGNRGGADAFSREVCRLRRSLTAR